MVSLHVHLHDLILWYSHEGVGWDAFQPDIVPYLSVETTKCYFIWRYHNVVVTLSTCEFYLAAADM